jgi:hypothetical protein
MVGFSEHFVHEIFEDEASFLGGLPGPRDEFLGEFNDEWFVHV